MFNVIKHSLKRSLVCPKTVNKCFYSVSNYGLHKILSNAEQIVGYNTSFLSLKSLFSDEISNIAFNLKSIVDKKHPLLKATKNMAYGDYNIVQLHGLIILLISKLFGFSPNYDSFTPAEVDQGITLKQRSLSEITQLIYMAKLLQRGITEFSNTDTVDKSTATGNNLAILSGDYLLASACNDLAKLENTQVVEDMSQAIADQMIDEYSNYNYQASNPASNNNKTLEQRPTILTPTYVPHNLLAYSSSCVLKLVNHQDDKTKVAFEFGDCIGQALEVCTNLKGSDEITNIAPLQDNYKKYEMCLEKLNSSLGILSKFPKSEVKMILENVIKSFMSIAERLKPPYVNSNDSKSKYTNKAP